jgi:bifunctional non-homologous end joining protein LigD
MLATKPKSPLSGDFVKDFRSGLWVFEPKYDGVRCIAMDGRLWSRAGNDITDRFPEIKADPYWTLDGEIIMRDKDGWPKFNVVQHRSASNARSQIDNGIVATYMVFDVLKTPQYPGTYRLDQMTLAQRRKILESIDEVDGVWDPRIELAPQIGYDDCADPGKAMWEASMAMGHEGVLAKHSGARYHQGNRSSDWVKVKKSMTVSCVVAGAEEGKGSRSGTFGALLLYMRDGTNVVPVGKAGTGFNEADLQMLTALLNQGQPFVVEVQCMEVTKDRKLRFPVYLGVRTDIDLLDCTIDQLA